MLVVLALGGHALTDPDGGAGVAAQVRAARRAMSQAAELLEDGVGLVLTHGNGPQVGDLLRLNEEAGTQTPLDWCVAQTQGSLGLALMNALDDQLRVRDLDLRACALVTRVLVSADDPAFASPDKPIGPRSQGRVVASPDPVRILEAPAIRALVRAGLVVVAAGGGGVPVVRRADGTLDGVEAVVDKDLAAALLGELVEADVLVIATDVSHAMTDHGTPEQAPVGTVTVSQMEALAAQGHFPAGSMGPKVEAMCRFVRAGGRRAVLTDLSSIAAAVDPASGDVGTVVVPDPPEPAGRSGRDEARGVRGVGGG